MPSFPITTSISALQAYHSGHNYLKLKNNASISSWVIESNAVAGLYRVQVYMATSSPGSGSVIATVNFSDDAGNKSLVIPGTLALTINNFATSPPVLLRVVRGVISFDTDYAPDGAYNMFVALERIL